MGPGKTHSGNLLNLSQRAGKLPRLPHYHNNKDVYPIGFQTADEDRGLCQKVVCHYLLEKMTLAGVSKTVIVLRNGK